MNSLPTAHSGIIPKSVPHIHEDDEIDHTVTEFIAMPVPVLGALDPLPEIHMAMKNLRKNFGICHLV